MISLTKYSREYHQLTVVIFVEFVDTKTNIMTRTFPCDTVELPLLAPAALVRDSVFLRRKGHGEKLYKMRESVVEQTTI